MRTATPQQVDSSERPSKILQNETNIIKICRAVLEIFNFNDQDFGQFSEKKRQKIENVVFRGFVQTEKQCIV